jgi:hypothetical protein
MQEADFRKIVEETRYRMVVLTSQEMKSLMEKEMEE